MQGVDCGRVLSATEFGINEILWGIFSRRLSRSDFSSVKKSISMVGRINSREPDWVSVKQEGWHCLVPPMGWQGGASGDEESSLVYLIRF